MPETIAVVVYMHNTFPFKFKPKIMYLYLKNEHYWGKKKKFFYPVIQILTPLKRDSLECKTSRVWEKVWYLAMGILWQEHTSLSVPENSPPNQADVNHL